MTADHPDEPTVPVRDLRTLVEEWQEFGSVPGWDGYSNGVREATESCATELEELVAEYE